MEEITGDHVFVYVDPCCPFAWITFRWLTEVERSARIHLDVRLLSLAVVNEQRALDDWYRGFNDRAWGPARVMAAIADRHGSTAARHFDEAFGNRFHVQLGTGDDVDRRAVTVDALAAARLPAALIGPVDDACCGRATAGDHCGNTRRVGLDVGVPVVEIDGVGIRPGADDDPEGR